MTEQLHFSELWPHWPALLAGLWVTIQLTVMATVGGLAIGIFGAAIRSGRPTWYSRIWGSYVEIIRNTPFVVQLFFIVFGLPNLGLKMTAGEAALLAMVVNLGAYSTEIIRAGIQSISRGQSSAALALGMTHWQSMQLIILPQAFRAMVPLLLTQGIVLFQDTSLVYVLSLADFFRTASTIGERDGTQVEMVLFAGAVYFVISLSASLLVSWLKKRTV